MFSYIIVHVSEAVPPAYTAVRLVFKPTLEIGALRARCAHPSSPTRKSSPSHPFGVKDFSRLRRKRASPPSKR
eukprot:1768261-Prymnesium_polylepis.1